MTWTLSRSIRRRRTRIPLIHNDRRSYSPPAHPMRFVFQASNLDRPHPSTLLDSKPATGKRNREEFERTCGPRFCIQEDEDTACQGESNLKHNASSKRYKYIHSPEERHPCHRYRQEETPRGSSMRTPHTICNTFTEPALEITTSASDSEVSLQYADAPSLCSGEKESTALTKPSHGGNEVHSKEDRDVIRGGEEARSLTPEKEVSAASFNGQEGLVTAEAALKKDTVSSTSTDADTDVPTDKDSEAAGNDDEITGKSPQIPQIMSRRPLFPITNDIMHKYQSAKVVLDFWAQLERISTSEDDFIRLFTALYNDEDSEAVARLPPPPVFPLKSCLRNGSILGRLNALTATPGQKERTEPIWRSNDGVYLLNDVPNNLQDLTQSYLNHLLRKYDPNEGWSQDFILANLRRAVLSAKAGLLSGLNGETTGAENETNIKEIVKRKCGNAIEDKVDNTRPRKVKFNEKVDYVNIEDGSRSQLGHPEEGVWSRFARGTRPAENPESESARAQISGLAPVEEDVQETQNLGTLIDSPKNVGKEPSLREEQDQNSSATNLTSSTLLPKLAPIPRQPKSHWKAIIQHLEDAARDIITAYRPPPPLQASVRDCGLSISPHTRMRRERMTREHDLRFVRPENILHENHEEGGEDTDGEDNGSEYPVSQDNWNDRNQERGQTEGEGDDPEFTIRGHRSNDLDGARNIDNTNQDGDPSFTVWNDRWNAQVGRDELDDNEDWYDHDTDDLEEPLINIWDNDLDDDDDDKENRNAQANRARVLTDEAEGESEGSNGYIEESENIEPSKSSHFRLRVFHKPTSPEFSSPVCQVNEYSSEHESDGQPSPRRSPCHFMPEHDFEEGEPVASPRTPRNRTRVFHRPTSPVYENNLPISASQDHDGTAASPPLTEREMPRFPISPESDSLYCSPIDRPRYRTSPSPEPWSSALFPDPESPSFER